MKSAEPPSPRSPFPPADARRRAAARVFDLALPVAVLLSAPRGHLRAPAVMAAALVLCADALFGPGRSIGKRLFGLRAVQVPSGRPVTIPRALARNAVFAVPFLPALFELRWEALGALACAVALEAFTALRPLLRELGQRRLGDQLAGTQVIDARIALPLPQVVPFRRSAAAPAPSPLSRKISPHKEPACASRSRTISA